MKTKSATKKTKEYESIKVDLGRGYKLRFRHNSNGTKSIVLYASKDYKTTTKTLGEIKVAPKGVLETEHNKATYQKCIREAFDIVGKGGLKQSEINDKKILAAFEEYYKEREEKKRTGLRSVRATINSLKLFIKEEFEVEDMNLKKANDEATRDFYIIFSERFWEYLIENFQRTTPVTYYNTYCRFFTWLKKHKYIDINPNSEVELEGKTEKARKKQALSIEEVKQLLATPYHVEYIRAFAAFGLLTGLRHSDLAEVVYRNIQNARLKLRMVKTNIDMDVDLNSEVWDYIPKNNNLDAKVFENLPNGVVCNYHLLAWAKKAGITTHLTCHVLRVTFATIFYENTPDIYLLSTFLGHTNISQTLKYVDIRKLDKTRAMEKFTSFRTAA